MIESAELQELLAKWDSNEGRPFKGSLIDMRAYEASPDSLGCMCAQGQVLHVVRKMSAQEISSIEQKKADELVMETLGISRGHAILLRLVNDKVDGAPSIVLTHPEKVLGEHAQLVLAFFKYLDSMDDAAWQKYFAAWEAAWEAARAVAVAAASAAAAAALAAAAGDAAWEAAWDAARAVAWDAAWDAARAAAGAANEIQGHKVLADKGKPLFFLSLFGFQTIQALIDWVNQ